MFNRTYERMTDIMRSANGPAHMSREFAIDCREAGDMIQHLTEELGKAKARNSVLMRRISVVHASETAATVKCSMLRERLHRRQAEVDRARSRVARLTKERDEARVSAGRREKERNDAISDAINARANAAELTRKLNENLVARSIFTSKLQVGAINTSMLKPTLDDDIDDVMRRVGAEVRKAVKKHRPWASAHEGHSVISEELDELWDHVKADTGYSADAMSEAIQIAAAGARYVLDLQDREALAPGRRREDFDWPVAPKR